MNITKDELIKSLNEDICPEKAHIEAITKDELIKALNEIIDKQKNKDICPEMSHIEADSLLLDFINDNKVTELYESIEKRYC